MDWDALSSTGDSSFCTTTGLLYILAGLVKRGLMPNFCISNSMSCGFVSKELLTMADLLLAAALALAALMATEPEFSRPPAAIEFHAPG